MNSTYKNIHLYYGLMAQGIEKATDKKYNGAIGPSTLQKLVENPLTFSVKPYLIPLVAAHENDDIKKCNTIAFHSIFGFHQNEKLEDPGKLTPIECIRVMSETINQLRQRGYDVDGLIERGEAIVHAEYSAYSLL